jgi:ubiquinone/menaquinone biosynthesis C-methylase UbiE
VSERVDFSANAPVYDCRHGAALAPDVARSLAMKAALTQGTRVLDVGAGTGRVAHALADLGCDVVALDPASPMLDQLRSKASTRRVRAVVGEGARLPFAACVFDAAVIARVLYLVADWRAVLQETHDALKPGGYLLHEWGNGTADEEWVRIREKTRVLFQDAGVAVPFHPGARTEAEVDDYLATLGLAQTDCVPAGPGPEISLREFVHRITSGELSYTWSVPKPVQEHCLPLLQRWCEQTFDLERSFPMPRELQWMVYRKGFNR